MAQLFIIDSSAKDGGLVEVFQKVGVANKVWGWVLARDGCDSETLADWFGLFNRTSWEHGVKTKLESANLEGIGKQGTDFEKQTARLRQCYRVAQYNFENDLMVAKTPKPDESILTEDQLDAGLGKKEQADLNEAWDQRYSVTIQAWLMGCDSLKGRTRREWISNTPTVPDLSKVRSQVAAVMPPTTKHVAMGSSMCSSPRSSRQRRSSTRFATTTSPYVFS